MSNAINEDEDGGAGGASVAGYEYQIDVSVWLALDLALAKKRTHELVLEPVSEEDIEADLGDDAPGHVTSIASVDSYRLIVQAKLRTGDAWSVATINSLLKHGKERASAAKRLADPAARYLLVTSAALNGGARDLGVRQAGSWPKPALMPATIVADLPRGAAGRVAVIGNQDEERLTTDIRTLLTEAFRVPFQRWDECRRALREAARARIRGAGGGRWNRTEIEEIIRAHEGYIASSPELEHYVHPTNWPDLRTAIRERRAVLIVGQSGTGKTLATKKLYEELRREIPGLARVKITHGPQQIESDTTLPPVLFDIEDPWGRFDFDPKSRPWNDRLPEFFARARPDRLYVATSRLDVAQQSAAYAGVRPWIVSLEAEHYGPDQRRRLYQHRIAALPRELQLAAMRSEREVLKQLATPLEIQKFFDALPTVDGDIARNSENFIGKAIARAHQDAIESTVVNQIEERSDIAAASILWGMLKANDRLSLSTLQDIEEHLLDLEVQLGRGISQLVNFFVAARNFRQIEETISYYHPRVEAGIEQALHRNQPDAVRTLRRLIDVLVSPDGPGVAWGASVAARLIQAIDRNDTLRPRPTAAAQAKIDEWLSGEVAKGGKEFSTSLELAASAGSPNCNIAEAARFLLHRPNRTFIGLDVWGPPNHDPGWYDRLRSDPSIRQAISTFISDVLPTHHATVGAEFVPEVERLATDLSEAFLVAAKRVVHYGVTNTSDAIFEGALNDLIEAESILDAAVTVLTPTASDRARSEELQLALTNGEFSEDYADHLADDDEGYTAGEFLSAYVDRVRGARGWNSLAQHRHRDRLRWYWLRAIAKDKEFSAREMEVAFPVGWDSNDEDDLWIALARQWNPRFLDQLMLRVFEGGPIERVRTEAMSCLLLNAPDRLRGICQDLMTQERFQRLVEIALEISELRRSNLNFCEEVRVSSADAALALMPMTIRELSEANSALEAKSTPILPATSQDFLNRLSNPTQQLRIFRIMLDEYVSLDVDDDIRWILGNAAESDVALVAIDAAIRRAMAEEVRNGLSHKFAAVVARALTAVGEALAAPLPQDLLRLAGSKGNYVRKALVKLLDEKPHRDHLPTLLLLAKDEWSRSARYPGEDHSYPIAREAVTAISKIDHIDSEFSGALYDIAIGTSDPQLRGSIFTILVRKSEVHFQQRIFELAIMPGRATVRRQAAWSLVNDCTEVDDKVVKRVGSQLVLQQAPAIAAPLVLLLSSCGEVEPIETVSKALAANPRRRVLLLLTLVVLWQRDQTFATRIGEMLPPDHVAVLAALGGKMDEVPLESLDDLGDPIATAEVRSILWPKARKS